jgi:hypothetical protein
MCFIVAGFVLLLTLLVDVVVDDGGIRKRDKARQDSGVFGPYGC